MASAFSNGLEQYRMMFACRRWRSDQIRMGVSPGTITRVGWVLAYSSRTVSARWRLALVRCSIVLSIDAT